jgi:hypothetical protein
LDPRITFTRASTGTFVGSDGLIKNAVSGAARFDHNPVTGESLGLLVEEARTNIWTRSEEFDNAAWTKTDTTVTANAATAPDGSLTADKLIASATTAVHSLSRIRTIVSPSWTTIYIKAAEYTICDIYDVNINSGFRVDLLTGVISASEFTFRPGQYGIDAVNNGWYRIRIGNPDSDSTLNNRVYVYPNGAQSFTGDGTSGIYIWGAQLEAGAFPTSYIPTTTATVTRAADILSIQETNFANWFNPSAGTFFCEWKSASPTVERILNFGTGPTATVISNEGVLGNGLYFSPLQQILGNVSANGIKVIVATSIAESAGAYNGNAAVSTGACSYYNSASSLNFSTSYGGRVNWYKKITYWPSRLSNVQLQALTQ